MTTMDDTALSPELAARPDMIVCAGVKKWFGDFQALKGVDLTVKDREVMVVLGPSGSGWRSLKFGPISAEKRIRVALPSVSRTSTSMEAAPKRCPAFQNRARISGVTSNHLA